MKKPKELTAEELRRTIDPETLSENKFDQTGAEVIGQERVKNALQLLEIPNKHFNVFVAGPHGSGKTQFVLSYLSRTAATKNPPEDLCYVQNFKEPGNPRLLKFPTGLAKHFAEELPLNVKIIKLKISTVSSDPEFKKTVQLIQQKISDELQEKLKKSKVVQESEKKEIYILFTAPLEFVITFKGADGASVEISGDDFYDDHSRSAEIAAAEDFSEEDKKKYFEELNQKYHGRFDEINDLMKIIYQKFFQAVSREENKLVEKTLDEYREQVVKSTLYNLAKHYPSAAAHLEELGDEFLKNLQFYIPDPQILATLQSAEERQEFFSQMVTKSRLLTTVNVIVDNSQTKGAPIIVETHPTYSRLYGYIEKIETKEGFLKPDFRNIKAGAIERANGGYLIIDAQNIFDQYLWFEVWRMLKQIIKDEKLIINDPRESLGMSNALLEPEPIPANVKIILVGSKRLWMMLHYYDSAFASLFHKAEIETDSALDAGLQNKICRHLRQFAILKSGKLLTKEALARLLECGLELAESQEKINMQIGKLEELVLEASAVSPQREEIDAAEVKIALAQKIFRNNLIEERYQKELIGKNLFKIDTADKKVGEINGLVVTSPYGDYTFGFPTKITANVSAGKKGLISIDRDVKMTGEIFDKSEMIINSYLQSRYAAQKPISLNAFLCFEQCYNGINGDSASIAEVAVLISEISGIPIRQDLAVTGSLNQKGVVQPIGGVNYKIKGFYRTCQEKGFTGKQGVVIPKDNAPDLMLPEEIIEAARNGQFHIYAAETIQEALELLLDKPMEEIDEAMKSSLKKFQKRDRKKCKDCHDEEDDKE